MLSHGTAATMVGAEHQGMVMVLVMAFVQNKVVVREIGCTSKRAGVRCKNGPKVSYNRSCRLDGLARAAVLSTHSQAFQGTATGYHLLVEG